MSKPMICTCVITPGTFFLPYSAKQQREMTKFNFCGVRGTHDGEILILCLNLNVGIPTNYVPRLIVQIECREEEGGGGGYKSHFPALFVRIPFPSLIFGKIPVPAVKFHGKTKLTDSVCMCGEYAHFRLGFFKFWSVLSPSVTNAMTIKLWVCKGRRSKYVSFEVRFMSWWCQVTREIRYSSKPMTSWIHYFGFLHFSLMSKKNKNWLEIYQNR